MATPIPSSHHDRPGCRSRSSLFSRLICQTGCRITAAILPQQVNEQKWFERLTGLKIMWHTLCRSWPCLIQPFFPSRKVNGCPGLLNPKFKRRGRRSVVCSLCVTFTPLQQRSCEGLQKENVNLWHLSLSECEPFVYILDFRLKKKKKKKSHHMCWRKTTVRCYFRSKIC